MQAPMSMMQGQQAPGFTAYIVEPPFGVARIVLLMVIPLLSMRSHHPRSGAIRP
jgi:hypothetical protein